MHIRLIKETVHGQITNYFIEKKEDEGRVWEYVLESLTTDEVKARSWFEEMKMNGKLSSREILAEDKIKIAD